MLHSRENIQGNFIKAETHWGWNIDLHLINKKNIGNPIKADNT